MTKQKRSYSGVVSDLRCANAEARGYLDRIVGLESQLKELQAYRDEYAFMRKIINYIIGLNVQSTRTS